VTALPCKVRDPDRKGKVESGVNHAQMTPLKGKKFESLEEAQAYLDHWEERWADKRIHGRTKRQVAAMFAEEKPFLQALPLEPFRYYQYGVRTVHLDGCVEVEAAMRTRPEPVSVRSPMPSMLARVNSESAASKACSRLPNSTAPLLAMRPAERRWSWA